MKLNNNMYNGVSIKILINNIHTIIKTSYKLIFTFTIYFIPIMISIISTKYDGKLFVPMNTPTIVIKENAIKYLMSLPSFLANFINKL